MSASISDTQSQNFAVNTENQIAWNIVSGLAGWMQLCCAKLIGGHIREDPARMILVEILQAQRSDYWIHIDQVPDGWPGKTQHVDVCLGSTHDKGKSNHGAIELKWPWNVRVNSRAKLRRDIIQDVARLVAIETAERPHIRYLVLGCMRKAHRLLFETKHKTPSTDRERQLFCSMFSMNLEEPDRQLQRSDILAAVPSYEERVPEEARLGHAGLVQTSLLALQHVILGTAHFGTIFVWQCDHVEGEPVQSTESESK